MNLTSAISRIALLQSLIVVIGTMTTCAILRFNGYTAEVGSNFLNRWNPVALAIREGGYFLLLVPVCWLWICIALERKESGQWNRSWSVASGLGVVLALISLLSWTTATPYFSQKRPIQSFEQAAHIKQPKPIG